MTRRRPSPRSNRSCRRCRCLIVEHPIRLLIPDRGGIFGLDQDATLCVDCAEDFLDFLNEIELETAPKIEPAPDLHFGRFAPSDSTPIRRGK
jgi:hypothetical protein